VSNKLNKKTSIRLFHVPLLSPVRNEKIGFKTTPGNIINVMKKTRKTWIA
jgi:hypothetical protein